MSIKMEKKLGFGTMRLPLIDPENPGSVDLEQFKRMADLYLERGFCFLTRRIPIMRGIPKMQYAIVWWKYILVKVF